MRIARVLCKAPLAQASWGTYIPLMKGQGRGFGFVVLIVVVVIVLILATRAWKAVMPAAAQAIQPGVSGSVPDHGQKGAGDAVRSGNLPNLKQMGRSTDAHTRQVNEASKSQD